jgi:hypothetical protein
MQFEGQGGLSSDADATVLAASAEDTTDAPAMVSTNLLIAEDHAASVYADDGAIEIVNEGAANNLKLALSFTQSGGNATLVGYLVKLQKLGTPASETNGFSIQVETDNAGDPSDTPVANTTVTKATSLIDDGGFVWYMFLLSRGSRGTLTNAVAYHIVVEGDWTASATDSIQIDTDAVLAGAQTCKYYDAAWAALALKNLCIIPLTMPEGNDDLKFGETTINLNNEVSLTPDDPSDAQGFPEADIMAADPTITVSPRETLDSEVDLAEYYDDQDDVTFYCQIGSTAGNIVELFGIRGVVVDTTEDERDGKMARSLMIRLDREQDGTAFKIRYR